MSEWALCPHGCGPLAADQTCPACGFAVDPTLDTTETQAAPIPGGHASQDRD